MMSDKVYDVSTFLDLPSRRLADISSMPDEVFVFIEIMAFSHAYKLCKKTCIMLVFNILVIPD